MSRSRTRAKTAARPVGGEPLRRAGRNHCAYWDEWQRQVQRRAPRPRAAASTDGPVLIDDTPAVARWARVLCGNLALVDHQVASIRGTVLNNLTMYGEGDGHETALSVARLIGLEDDIYSLPRGYETRLGEAATEPVPPDFSSASSLRAPSRANHGYLSSTRPTARSTTEATNCSAMALLSSEERSPSSSSRTGRRLLQLPIASLRSPAASSCSSAKRGRWRNRSPYRKG